MGISDDYFSSMLEEEREVAFHLLKKRTLTQKDISFLFSMNTRQLFHMTHLLPDDIIERLTFLFLYLKKYRLYEQFIKNFAADYWERPIELEEIYREIKNAKTAYDVLQVYDFTTLEEFISDFVNSIKENKDWTEWLEWFNGLEQMFRKDPEAATIFNEVAKKETFKAKVKNEININGPKYVKEKLLAIIKETVETKGLDYNNSEIIGRLVEDMQQQDPQKRKGAIFEELSEPLNLQDENIKKQFYDYQHSDKKSKCIK